MTINILLERSYSKKQIFIPVLVILLIISSVSVGTLISTEKDNENTLNNFNNIIKEINSNDIIIHTNHAIFWTSDNYFLKKYPNYLFNIRQNTPKNNKKTLNKIENVLNNNEKQGKVWLFAKNDEIDSFNKTLNQRGYTIKESRSLLKAGSDNSYPETICLIVKIE